MIKICKLAAITVCILFFLSGCWDSTDIQQENIHIAEVIDYKDGNYNFYGEIANLSGKSQKSGDNGKNNSQDFSIVKASGRTLTEARDGLNRKSSMPIYLGACKILVFTNRMSSLGVEEYLNRSRAQRDTRKSLKIITTLDEPEELLNVKPDSSASVGIAIDNIMENKIKEGSSFKVDIGSLLETLAVKKAGFLIPEMCIEDSIITLTGYTVFKNAKEIGFIPAEDARGVVFFLNPQSRFDYEIRKDSERFQLEAVLKNKKVKTSYHDGKLDIKVQMNFNAELNYMGKIRPINDLDKEQLQNLLAKIIKQDILRALETSQKEYCSDYLEIYRYFRADYNSDFKTIDWEQAYGSATVDVKTKVTLTYSELPQAQSFLQEDL